MDWFNQIWVWVVGGLSGITIGGVIAAIIVGTIKGSVSRVVQKINIQKTQEEAVNKGLKTIKAVSFKHSIQPIVESEIAKLNEKAVANLKEALDQIKAEYTCLVLILKKFAAYFDDSIVSDEKKTELHDAIESAETSPLYVESVAIEEELKESKKVESTPIEEPTQEADIFVER